MFQIDYFEALIIPCERYQRVAAKSKVHIWARGVETRIAVGVVVAPEARALRPFLVFSTRFWARPGPVFCPPNARFWVSCLVEYTTVILRLSCIEIAQVIFQKKFEIFHQQGPYLKMSTEVPRGQL